MATQRRATRRPRGSGAIEKIGPVYHIRWIGLDGKRHRHTTDSANYQRAQAMLADKLAEIRQGVNITNATNKVRLNEAIAIVRDEAQGNKAAWTVTYRTEHLIEAFGAARPLTSITASTVADYRKDRTTHGAAVATVNRELAELRRAFNLCRERGLITIQPVIKLKPENNVRTGFATHAEIKAITRHLPDDVADIVWFGFFSGWRAGEILGLRVTDIDHAAGVIRIEGATTKEGNPRELPLVLVQEVIDRCLARVDCWRKAGRLVSHVFIRDKNGLPVKDFRTVWTKAVRAAGKPGLIFHDLKRSAVRNMEDAGTPRSLAMTITGHRTESIYQRYAITDRTRQIAAAEKIVAWLQVQRRRSGHE